MDNHLRKNLANFGFRILMKKSELSPIDVLV